MCYFNSKSKHFIFMEDIKPIIETLELTQFQIDTLSQLVNIRQKAQADEAEFVVLCANAAGKKINSDSKVKFENGKLVW